MNLNYFPINNQILIDEIISASTERKSSIPAAHDDFHWLEYSHTHDFLSNSRHD